MTRWRSCCISRALASSCAVPAGRRGSSAAAPGRRAGSWRACAAPRPRAASGSAPRRPPAARASCRVASWHRNASSRRQQHRLVDGLRTGRPNATPTDAQHVVRVELGANELRRDDLFAVELLEQTAHDRRLAGTDLAGDDDETLALIEPVLQIRERALVPAAAEEERGIGIELEGLAGQAVDTIRTLRCQRKR